jgi:RNA polymerase sigma-70 factor (ECF subfamily)
MPTPDSNSDAPIQAALQRVLRGEVAAFEPIVRQFERPLRAWLAGQAPPGVDVDEVAQRSFVAAFTRIREFQLGTNFGAWLFTIAHYQLRTETTRLRRVADYHARYAPDLLQKELERRADQTPEYREMQLENLRSCLETLGAHFRRFITWRYEEEIPLEEMAARSGRTVAAVKKQLWVLRQKLQECVETRMAAAEGGTR